jgi:hypothetical protein
VFPIAVRGVRLYSTNLSLLAVDGLELDIAAVCVSRRSHKWDWYSEQERTR